MRRITLAWAAFVLGLVSSTSPLSAAVICVKPGGNDANDGLSWERAKQTVGAGLDTAIDGDQVWVATGTYVGCITLKSNVGLYGGFAGNEDPAEFNLDDRDITSNVTTLDGNQAGSVVSAPPEATATCRIDGFTITNGSSVTGGGMYLYRSSPTIANNTITGNSATVYYYGGGGLYLEHSSPMIVNNEITKNTAISSSGGGLYLYASHPTIANNMISDNTSTKGGGIYMYRSFPNVAANTITGNVGKTGGGMFLNSSSPTIASNQITGNIASAFAGGGLFLGDSAPTIANNSITQNTAAEGGGLSLQHSFPRIANNAISNNFAKQGGGLHLVNSSPTMASNTIAGNRANGLGGGLYLWNYSSPTISNTIIASNSSGVYCTGGSSPKLAYNCAYDNRNANYVGITDPTGTNGNISADPMFVDLKNGDCHISAGSPCIDAADSTAVPNGITTELGGLPRFVDDPNTPDTGNGAPPIVDIGAYEFQARRGDLNCDGAVDFNDIDPFVTALISKSDYSTQYPACVYLNADIDRDDSVNYSDIDGFVECLINNGCP